jgi:hypothetical protein
VNQYAIVLLDKISPSMLIPAALESWLTAGVGAVVRDARFAVSCGCQREKMLCAIVGDTWMNRSKLA